MWQEHHSRTVQPSRYKGLKKSRALTPKLRPLGGGLSFFFLRPPTCADAAMQPSAQPLQTCAAAVMQSRFLQQCVLYVRVHYTKASPGTLAKQVRSVSNMCLGILSDSNHGAEGSLASSLGHGWSSECKFFWELERERRPPVKTSSPESGSTCST